MKRMLPSLALLALVGGLVSPANAQMIRITIKNHAPSNPTGLYNGPVWLGFHNGGFDMFDSGNTASAAVEALAELGSASMLDAAFMASQPSGFSLVLNNPGGPGPGIFTPGSSNSADLTINATDHRFLSFGSMIVPSNDSFVGNADAQSLALFNSSGSFLGAQAWTLTGASVWDAGTEMNDPTNGAAFVAGVDATLGTSEGGTIHLQPLDGLDDAIGLMTPAGTTIGRALGNDPLLSISITPIPEPGTYGLIAAAGLLALARWRRRAVMRELSRSKVPV